MMQHLVQPLFATQAGAEMLLQALKASSDIGSSALDSVWSLFLQGDLYSLVSKTAAVFTIIPLSLFVINSFRNRTIKDIDERFFTGDVITYILVGLILSSLVFPIKTGSLLYAGRQTTVAYSNRLITTANSIAGDPNAAMASIVAGKAQNALGMQACNREGDETKRTDCIQKIADANQVSVPPTIDSQGNLDFGTVVQDALKLPGLKQIGQLLAFDGDMFILTLIVPVLVTIGTAFILLLEMGMLICCMMTPFVLLVGIANRGYIAQWFQSYWAWALISVAYKLIMVSVAFGMMTTGFTDVLLYAVIAGLGAPWLAVKAVAGESMGLLTGVGAIASKLIGR